jgi:hypothetical protein
MSDYRANPFLFMGSWYWRDEKEFIHGPYHSQTAALRGLMKHISPGWGVRMLRLLKELWKDERG